MPDRTAARLAWNNRHGYVRNIKKNFDLLLYIYNFLLCSRRKGALFVLLILVQMEFIFVDNVHTKGRSHRVGSVLSFF